jgi:endogenous inhibitor of DNA gyrase (YacG/DUF329 family)
MTIWYATICDHCGNPVAVQRKTDKNLECPFCRVGRLVYNGKSTGNSATGGLMPYEKRIIESDLKIGVELPTTIGERSPISSDKPSAILEALSAKLENPVKQSRIDSLRSELAKLEDKGDKTGSPVYNKMKKVAVEIWELSGRSIVPKNYVVKKGKLYRSVKVYCPTCNLMISKMGMNRHKPFCKGIHANDKTSVVSKQKDTPAPGFIEGKNSGVFRPTA